MKRFLKPHFIYIAWTILVLGFLFIGIPVANIGHSGGEQIPLTLLAYSIQPILIGYLLISIFTSIIFLDRFKKYWFLNLIVFSLTAYLLVSFWIR